VWAIAKEISKYLEQKACLQVRRGSEFPPHLDFLSQKQERLLFRLKSV